MTKCQILSVSCATAILFMLFPCDDHILFFILGTLKTQSSSLSQAVSRGMQGNKMNPCFKPRLSNEDEKDLISTWACERNQSMIAPFAFLIQGPTVPPILLYLTLGVICAYSYSYLATTHSRTESGLPLSSLWTAMQRNERVLAAPHTAWFFPSHWSTDFSRVLPGSCGIFLSGSPQIIAALMGIL